ATLIGLQQDGAQSLARVNVGGVNFKGFQIHLDGVLVVTLAKSFFGTRDKLADINHLISCASAVIGQESKSGGNRYYTTTVALGKSSRPKAWRQYHSGAMPQKCA